MAEIERKFLITNTPELTNCPKVLIIQGYIEITPDSEVRIRSIDGCRFYRTIKNGSGLMRQETETELNEGQFNLALPGVIGKLIQKVRYYKPYPNCKNSRIELDKYQGHLAGLLVVELEFDNLDQATTFKPLSWFGQEVTDDQRYKNKNLALEGMPDNKV